MIGPIFYQPYISYSASVDSTFNSLQGIKKNNYHYDSYLLAGTTGSAISAPGYGALYVGAIDGSSTSDGSGSGTWYNFSVPYSWSPQETSAYGPDILGPGSGPGGIGEVAVAGTWINSSGVLLGWYYSGDISGLDSDTAGMTAMGFQSFQATTKFGSPADYTYLHSADGGYVVGNYTTSGGPIALSINSGLNSGSYIYNPLANLQIDIQYSDSSQYHSAFGIWANEDNTYTISGGAALDQNSPFRFLYDFDSVTDSVKEIAAKLPDAALGRGMLADVDPITGAASNIQYYNYGNRSDVLTHFQGIYYMGSGVYQAPFVAIDLNGQAHTGNAYMHRLSDGRFAEEALWQTFESSQQGVGALISTSVSGNANTGVYSTLSPFASIGIVDPYFAVARTLDGGLDLSEISAFLF